MIYIYVLLPLFLLVFGVFYLFKQKHTQLNTLFSLDFEQFKEYTQTNNSIIKQLLSQHLIYDPDLKKHTLNPILKLINNKNYEKLTFLNDYFKLHDYVFFQHLIQNIFIYSCILNDEQSIIQTLKYNEVDVSKNNQAALRILIQNSNNHIISLILDHPSFNTNNLSLIILDTIWNHNIDKIKPFINYISDFSVDDKKELFFLILNNEHTELAELFLFNNLIEINDELMTLLNPLKTSKNTPFIDDIFSTIKKISFNKYLKENTQINNTKESPIKKINKI